MRVVDLMFVASYAILWLIVGFVVFVLLSVIKELALRADSGEQRSGDLMAGPPVGSIAPQLDVGDSPAVDSGPALIVFLSPECQGCRSLMPHLSIFGSVSTWPLYIVSQGSQEQVAQLMAVFPVRATTLLDANLALHRAFGISSTPFAVAVDHDWVVRASGGVSDIAQLANLVLESARASAPSRALLPSTTGS